MQIICYEFKKKKVLKRVLKENNLHLEFNNICLNENLLPIYTNIIYIGAIFKSSY